MSKITRQLVSIFWADVHALNDNGTSEITPLGGCGYEHDLGELHSEAITKCASLYRDGFRCWVVPYGENWDSPSQLLNGQPQFRDDCGHGFGSWYGHVELPEIGWCDLRFFQDPLLGWEYCARYGELGEYRSFPVETIAELARREGSDFDRHIVHAFVQFINQTARERTPA